MNWRTAHRNKRRVLRRKVEIEPGYFMRNPDITWEQWFNEFLPRLAPTMLNENSLMARILQRSTTEPLTWRTRLPERRPFRGLPYYAEPDPQTSGVFQGPSRYIKIVDDIDLSKPCEPKPTKRFIYGDNWTAYQLLRNE